MGECHDDGFNWRLRRWTIHSPQRIKKYTVGTTLRRNWMRDATWTLLIKTMILIQPVDAVKTGEPRR
jgi:hypothetical protein